MLVFVELSRCAFGRYLEVLAVRLLHGLVGA